MQLCRRNPHYQTVVTSVRLGDLDTVRDLLELGLAQVDWLYRGASLLCLSVSLVHCSVEIISQEFIVMLRQLSYAIRISGSMHGKVLLGVGSCTERIYNGVPHNPRK